MQRRRCLQRRRLRCVRTAAARPSLRRYVESEIWVGTKGGKGTQVCQRNGCVPCALRRMRRPVGALQLVMPDVRGDRVLFVDDALIQVTESPAEHRSS